MRLLPALAIVALSVTTSARAAEPQPMSIAFWNERAGLLVSGTVGPADVGRSTLSLTHDGGRSWSVVASFPGRIGVSAVRGTRVAFMATSHGLLRTRDSAGSWDRVSPRAVERPDFATPTVGWALEEEGRLLSTRDGGRTWRALRSPCRKWDTPAISLASPARGWVACGSQPGAGQQPKELWSTRDGGSTFQLVNRASPFGRKVGRGLCVCGYLAGIRMTSSGAGWLWMARGSFYATRDGGRTWAALPVSAPETVEGRSASLLTAEIGYALFGHRPALRATRDGGRTWIVVRRWSR